MHYNFRKDLALATEVERSVGEQLLERFPERYGSYTLNEDAKWDLQMFCVEGKPSTTFEVKRDYMAKQTGNVAVEFECRGKASGINNSKADAWIYVFEDEAYVISLKNLREMCQNPNMIYRTVIGGDKGSNTKMHLFKKNVFCAQCLRVF